MTLVVLASTLSDGWHQTHVNNGGPEMKRRKSTSFGKSTGRARVRILERREINKSIIALVCTTGNATRRLALSHGGIVSLKQGIHSAESTQYRGYSTQDARVPRPFALHMAM